MNGQAFLLFDVRFRWCGEDFGEPVVDAGDDLADASLGDFEVCGDAVGGEELDGVLAVDFEVAGGGRSKVESRRSAVMVDSGLKEGSGFRVQGSGSEPCQPGVYAGVWTSLVLLGRKSFGILGNSWGSRGGAGSRRGAGR